MVMVTATLTYILAHINSPYFFTMYDGCILTISKKKLNFMNIAYIFQNLFFD